MKRKPFDQHRQRIAWLENTNELLAQRCIRLKMENEALRAEIERLTGKPVEHATLP